MSDDLSVLSPAQQADIIKQYGSLAAARAAMSAPAPPPMGAPVAPPPVVVAPPPPPAAAAPPPVAPPAKKKSSYSPFADHDSFGGVNPADVAAAQEEHDHPTPSAFGRIKEGMDIGEAWHAVMTPPPAAPAAAPATPPVDPATVKFASPKEGPSAPAATPGINWGSVGGSVTIPAHEVPLATAKRQGELMGAIDAQGRAVDAEGKALESQQSAAGAVADANAGVERARGVGEYDQAKAAIDAGQGVKERAAKAADESKAYRTRIDEFSEKLAKDKIDPNGMWNNASVPQRITWTLAKMLGAVGQAFLHLPTNQVADELERMAAQDVATQRANHEMGREHMADLNTMYGQALHATGNAEEAERVATGYALEAIKHQAQGFVNGAQSKVQEAKGKELISEIGSRIVANGERRAAVDEKKAETGIKLNPLAQARTVGAGGVDMAKVYASARERIKDQAADGHIISPDEAIRWAYKLHTGNDPQPGAGAFAGGAKGDPANKELRETQTATDEFNRQIDGLAKHPVITGSGLGTAIGAQLPQRVAPDSNDAQQQLNAINTRNLQAIGKVAKDADGKPNKEMIKKIEERFEIHLADTPEMKQQKLQGVREVYNALARQQGAKAPEPNKGPPPGMAP